MNTADTGYYDYTFKFLLIIATFKFLLIIVCKFSEKIKNPNRR